MDQFEGIINMKSKKRQRVIDSGEEEIMEEQVETTRTVTSEKAIIRKIDNHDEIRLDRKKLRYLFEPDESLEEEEEVVVVVPVKKVRQEPAVSKLNQAQVNSLEDLRIEILKRWWYCFEEWPPSNWEYYAQKLMSHNLRRVEFTHFKREPELEQGLRKVYQIDGYPGVFKTSAGDTLDLRPLDTCPSIENISKINPKTLPSLYIKGLKAQLNDLINHEPNNTSLAQELKFQLGCVEKKFNKYLE